METALLAKSCCGSKLREFNLLLRDHISAKPGKTDRTITDILTNGGAELYSSQGHNKESIFLGGWNCFIEHTYIPTLQ